MPEDTILSRQSSVNLVPFIGQRFVSQDAAYEFYCSFAKQCGFSIRRHRTWGFGTGITRRDFTCHRGGYPRLKHSEDGKLQRNRKIITADFNVPEWPITGFSNVHNHELLESTEVQLIPAYCTMSPDDKSRICMFAKPRMLVRQMLRLMELEKGVKLGCLPFTEVDVRNLLQSLRNVEQDNDPIDLLKIQIVITGFEHIAWSYASSMKLYEVFGYAVVFDTTHSLDAYDMLLGIWIEVDNHGSHCFFGCVLLRDEKLQSFSWELKTSLGFMSGKAPGTILTDQNLWLKEAIATEIPRVEHAFFHCLYNLHSIEEYEVGWNEMVEPTGWTEINTLTIFLLCWMTSTFQSDSINTYIHRFLSAQSALDNSLEQVARVVDAKDQAGRKHKLQRNIQKVPLKTEELVFAPEYASLMVDESYFFVRHHKEIDGGYKVLWVPHYEFISCNCHNFEFTGILCRHVLRVLSTNNCFHIPDQYLPMHWHEFTSSLLLQSMISTLINESLETEERLNVACDEVSAVLSRIKGFPTASSGCNAIAYESPSCYIFWKDRGSRYGLDLFGKRRCFSIPCGQYGHDANDCPMMEGEDLSGDRVGFL
ncbi:unnamed protein product [Withania somnifera]